MAGTLLSNSTFWKRWRGGGCLFLGMLGKESLHVISGGILWGRLQLPPRRCGVRDARDF